MALISKKKLLNAVLLFESKVTNGNIKNIEIITSTYYIFDTGERFKYSVNLSTNEVDKSFPDPDYD